MESKEQKLLRLAADHAYWANQVRHYKEMGAYEYSCCDGVDSAGEGRDYHTFGIPCIEAVFDELKKTRSENPYDYYDFDEIYQIAVSENRVCEHCQKARDHKKERIYASRRLGQVRSAITRIGKNLTPSIKGE